MRTRNSGKRSSLRGEPSDNEGSPEKIIKVASGKKGKRKTTKRISVSTSDKGYGGSSCDDDPEEQKTECTIATSHEMQSASKRKSTNSIDESSDSSSDDYLVPSQSLDLNSDFFKVEKKEPLSEFSVIENNIFADINRLSDSEESDGFEELTTSREGKSVNKQVPQHGKQSLKAKQSDSAIKKKTVSEQNTDSKRSGKKTVAVKQQKPSAKIRNLQASQSENTLMNSVPVKIEKIDVLKEKGLEGSNRRQHYKVKVEHPAPDVSNLDVSQLLALGEGQTIKSEPSDSKPGHSGRAKKTLRKNDKDSEEDGVSDWEEVNTLEAQQTKHTIPKEGIAVTVKVPNIHEKKKKKGFDMAAYIKRRMNRVRRDIQVLMHKAHLLCWVAHGNFVNKILNSEILMGLSLSLIPSKHCYPDKHTDLNYLQQIVQWFSKNVEVVENAADNEQLLDSLQRQFQKKSARSKRDLVLMFICVLRSLGINTRLVISLQPVPLKPPISEISSLTTKKVRVAKGAKVKTTKGANQKKRHGIEKKGGPGVSKEVARKRRDIMTKEEAVQRIKEAAARKLQGENSNQKQKDVKPKATEKNSKSVSDSTRSLRARKSAKKYLDEPDMTDSEDEGDQNSKQIGDLKNIKASTATHDKSGANAKVDKKGANTKVGKGVPKNTKKGISNEDKVVASGSESDYSVDFKVKKKRTSGMDRRVLSSDSVSDETPVENLKKKKDRCDVWSEVFLESEERWICVDVYHRQVHCVRELCSRATQPVQYVLAWHSDGSIRDVTRRYCHQYHTVTRKHRVEEEWWRESLKPFEGQRTARDDQEDEDLDRQLQDRPLPTSLAEYKNHPLYVLKKDLLKFQAIYPPDAPTLGFVRGHPVYARECVHTLHSREIWLKEAKVVKLGETPYKIVKARPKWDRMSGQVIKDLPLEIFGIWQVEDYVPPTAVDGKVPRNAYGNVELFKPSMLPKGTVHMQIPGLNRVARKLQIDCAPAVTGFDFHCGASHPVFDGFVVCEEYKDVLAEAWQTEEEEADRRYEEKRLKRIYGNWRRLIKGLLIRERLKARYDFGSVTEVKSKGKKVKKSKEPKKMKIVDSGDSDWEMDQYF